MIDVVIPSHEKDLGQWDTITFQNHQRMGKPNHNKLMKNYFKGDTI